MKEEDLPWLYAAYVQGAFEVEEGLSKEEFLKQFFEYTSSAHEVYVAFSKLFRGGSSHDGEMVPVGVARTFVSGHRMEVHAVWFPWATARNVLESTVKFLANMRKDYLVLIFAKTDTKRFYEHVSRYGVLRRVGKIMGYYEDDDAHLFQARGG